jgi:branched-chain amino acid transport system ATP-binding protein
MFPPLGRQLEVRAGLLSGGERQQLALAVAVGSESRLLLIDELSLGLAPSVSQEVVERLGQITADERGISVIIAEPNLDVAFALAHRVAVIEEGVIVGIGPASAAMRASVEQMLLGSKEGSAGVRLTTSGGRG